MMPDSKREFDTNGWYEIQDNPLSKAGVFPYLGRNIPGAPNLDTVYYVYRPEEELADPECIASFKLLPWTDDHPPGLLGDEDQGLIPAEDKGVQGIVGEKVYYKDGTLYGNIKPFSQAMQELIQAGKKQLSCGYRSIYEWRSGVAHGQHYDVIQRRIRGNHLSLVNEGRMGADVAVLDAVTLDAKDVIFMNENENAEVETEKEITLTDVMTVLETIGPALQQMAASLAPAAPSTSDEEEEKIVEEVVVIEEENEGTNDKEDEDDKKTAAALDALDKEIKKLKQQQQAGFKTFIQEAQQRDKLAHELSYHVGTFDASDKTLADVVQYGIDHLKIKAPKGQETAFLRGYLAGAAAQEQPQASYVFDSSGGMGADSGTAKIYKYAKGGQQ